jgi:hypothetical protein
MHGHKVLPDFSNAMVEVWQARQWAKNIGVSF